MTFANNVVLGGHVSIGDNVFLGGLAAVHQFVRVGEGAMIGGLTGVAGDVIPFGFALGQIADLVGLNVVGLRRRGATRAELHRLRRAYRSLFFGAGVFADRLEVRGARIRRRSAGRQNRRVHSRRRQTAVDASASKRQAKTPTTMRPDDADVAASDRPAPAPVAIICGGGSFPGAVAEAVVRRGRRPVMFGDQRLGRSRSGRALRRIIGSRSGRSGVSSGWRGRALPRGRVHRHAAAAAADADPA